MHLEPETDTAPVAAQVDLTASEQPYIKRLHRQIELLSAIILALATIGTAWSAYQSARWGGERTAHTTAAFTATVRAAKFANLAQQRISLHVSLFGQWSAAVSTSNQPLADFLFDRFPEPLKSATVAWRATQPLTNPAAPATPFEMAEYALSENAQAATWETTALAEETAAERANEISDRYLLFTIIFAVVLFFGGVSGKFRSQALDVAVLLFGAFALLVGLVIVGSSPIK
ncbi:MAG: hypothetical protein H7Z42_10110 [Roseiflexaceae bacterium]|nr:hypothetical protein [Roseiflexaceae bacterium]